jgi:pimeloyl-ACP methyl ester carboxylesterase
MNTEVPLLAAIQQRYPARTVMVNDVEWTIRDTAPEETTRNIAPEGALRDTPPEGAPRATARQDAGRVPLLLLPGALGTGDVFYHLLASLGDRYRLMAVTYPPIGDMVKLARGVVGLLDALELPQVDLLGTSLGGYVAQLVALARPARLRKLVLANTFYDPGLQQKRWPPPAEFCKISAQDVLAAARAQLAAGAEPTPEHGDLKRVMLELVGAGQPAASVKAMRIAVLTAFPLGRVPLDDAAITLIDDDEDPVIAAPTRQQMRERYQNCRHIRIEGGGHFPSNLQPARYVAAVQDILQA